MRKLGIVCLTTILASFSLIACMHIRAVSSLPAHNDDMVGMVPYFYQTGDTCGLYSMMQVLWWFGRTDVTANDIGGYLDKAEGPHYLGELENAFAHYLPGSWHTHGGFEDAGEAREWVKSWINKGVPVICCIRAPGTWTGGWANHYVTIVGWDDARNGGSWCLHDTGGHWPGCFDVWCRYSDFDDLWDEWWTGYIGSYDTRGVVVADPGDWKLSYPHVGLSGVHDIYDDETMTFQVSLTNVGDDDSESAGPNGVHVQCVHSSMDITGVDLGEFDDYCSFDQSGTALGHVLPTRIIEFYHYGRLVPGATVSASVTARPYAYGTGAIAYRGWITDEDDMAREDWVTIYDSRPEDLNTMLAEPRILRYPYTSINDLDNVLDYPLDYNYFSVTDDDPDPPSIWGLTSSGSILDSYIGDYMLGVQGWDASDFEIAVRYWFDADPTWWSPWYGEYFEGFGDYTGAASMYFEIPRSEWIQHVGSVLYWQVWALDHDDDTPNDGASTSIHEVGGSILDDDTEPPSIIYPGLYVGEKLYPSEGVSDSYFGNVRLQVTIGSVRGFPPEHVTLLGDPSGVSTVRFWVFGSWRDATGFSDCTYWYDIPDEEWKNHVGEAWSWKVYAEDNDNDRPNDHAGAESSLYPGTTIWDDDTTTPTFSNPQANPTDLTDDYTVLTKFGPEPGPISLSVTVNDPSGISTVRFWVFDSWRDATRISGDTYTYLIQPEEWKNHVGEAWSWKVYAEDNDNDRPGDYNGAESSLYPGATITDDDETGPSFSNPSSEHIEHTQVFRTQIRAADPSGIYTVQFRYRFEDSSWTSWQTPTGSRKSTYWYDIPLDVWSTYCEQTIYWQSYAEDNDDDRFGDRANSLSTEYSGTLPGVPILQVTGESPINILVTDPNGLRVGYDPVLGPIYEIPGATYSGPGTEPQVVTIPNPVEGIYIVDAFGTGTGAYTISMDSYASDGSLSNSEIWSGTAEPDQQYTQAIELEVDGDIIDASPPTTDASLTGTLGLNGWYISGVDVELVATDGMSGVFSTEYSLDGTTWLSYTTSIMISDEGTTIIHYNSTDNEGNIEETKTDTIRIDETPPVVVASPDRASNANGWYNADVTVTFTATDVLSGVASVDAPVILTGEGVGQSVTGYATDLAGNVGAGALSEINIDKTPPTITGAPTESPNAWGWYNTDVTMQFTASDSLSDLDSVTPDLTLTSEGAGQSVTGYATDLAGNTASYTSTGINIDKTPPTITGAPTTSGNAWSWYKTDVVIHFEASDSLSEVGTVTPDQTLSAEGAGQSAIGIAADKAGNVASHMVDNINIDKTPPTITGAPTTSANAFGWYNSDVIVHFEATDSLSGIDTIAPEQTLAGEGSGQSVTGMAADKAGNSASYTVLGINIDKTSPTITGAPTTLPNAYGWYNHDVTVHFTASDALSGLDTVTPDQTLTGEGAGQSVIGVATDRAGNVASRTVDGINIDQTKPATTFTIGEPKFGTDPTYVSTTTDFNLDPTDVLSGIEYTEYRIDSGPWTLYSAPFNVLGFGSHTVYYHSIDLAGNSEDIQSVLIVVKETRLTYQGDTDGQYSDQVILEAKLIDMATQLPILGKPISFTLGSQTATATTDSTGVASVSIVLIQRMGAYTVTATFETDGEYFGSSDSQPFTIQKEDVIVEYTGHTVVPTTAKTINLRATVFGSMDGWLGDLTILQVTFNIYAGQLSSTPYMTIPAIPVSLTDTPGVGVAVATIDNFEENGYLIIVSIDPNDYYAGPTSDATALTVYEPTGDFVTGGGWLRDSSGSKGNFGFNIKYSKLGKPRGKSLYVYREDGWNYIVKSNAWIGMAIDGNHAYFEAKCVIQKYNPATGELVWDEGNYKFRVDVWDNDPDGGIDVYQIRVWDRNGLVFHEAGFDPIGYLQGGNIVIHEEKKKH